MKKKNLMIDLMFKKHFISSGIIQIEIMNTGVIFIIESPQYIYPTLDRPTTFQEMCWYYSLRNYSNAQCFDNNKH